MAIDRVLDTLGMKIMSANHITIFHIGKEESTQRTHNTCIVSHLALEADFTTSKLRSKIGAACPRVFYS